ncbi:MAG TPA: SPW repeat protein [Burkholderiales bacterium]|nr:SPW repeat protein [Burkholderiales bacterium]
MTVASTKWEDWASFVLGLWLAVSPWIAGYAEHELATGHAIVVGLVLALGSHFECVACDELPMEWLNLAVGVWLVSAPFTLEFGSRVAMANSIAVGAFVALLAASALSLDKHIGKLWHRRTSP